MYAAPIRNPYSKTRINQIVGPAGDGKTQVVMATCLMSLSGFLLRPVMSVLFAFLPQDSRGAVSVVKTSTLPLLKV